MPWYNENNDIINAYEEIIEDFEMGYYDPDPEEEDNRPEVYLKDLFAGARLRRGNESSFKPGRNDEVFEAKNYEDFVKYMKSVNYDSGYGSQNFFGFVLLSDDTWFERYSYDGKEYWAHKKRPELHKTI